MFDYNFSYPAKVHHQNLHLEMANNLAVAIYDEKIDEKNAKCIECVKIVPVFSINDLQPGDHVVYRHVNYDHHGIIISLNKNGSFEIIEVTNTSEGASFGISSSSFPSAAMSKAKIQKNTKIFQKGNIALVYYKYRCEKDKTVERAKYYAKENKSFKYHLFSNNCEHFATFCVTGHRFSLQVSKFLLSIKMLWQKGFSGISNEKERNKELHDRQLVCDSCFVHNRKLLNVDAIPLTSKRQVDKGDIIRFSYYLLMHDAVVLHKDNNNSNNNVVVLTIAHYAFCGLHEHRTVKEETMDFNLDGSCFIVNYASKFSLYESELVVNRARSRIGEQFFVFFSNDSSHFARWCKLKFILEILDC